MYNPPLKKKLQIIRSKNWRSKIKERKMKSLMLYQKVDELTFKKIAEMKS